MWTVRRSCQGRPKDVWPEHLEVEGGPLPGAGRLWQEQVQCLSGRWNLVLLNRECQLDTKTEMFRRHTRMAGRGIKDEAPAVHISLVSSANMWSLKLKEITAIVIIIFRLVQVHLSVSHVDVINFLTDLPFHSPSSALLLEGFWNTHTQSGHFSVKYPPERSYCTEFVSFCCIVNQTQI